MQRGSGKSRRAALQEVNEEGFIPRREIPRTPPRVNKSPPPGRDIDATENDDPDRNIVVTPVSKAKGNRENFPPDWLSPSDQKKVQATCFTPSSSLARSPPQKKFYPHDPQIDVPPVPRWEIPRSPITIKHSSPTPSLSHNQSGTSQNQPKNIPQNAIRPKPGMGMSLPHGLVCTEADIAYINRMKTSQQHNNLQV